MLNRPLKTDVALSAIEQCAPNSHAWLSQYLTELEQHCFQLRTGLLKAAADEAQRTGNQQTQYDKYLLPSVTAQEVTA